MSMRRQSHNVEDESAREYDTLSPTQRSENQLYDMYDENQALADPLADATASGVAKGPPGGGEAELGIAATVNTVCNNVIGGGILSLPMSTANTSVIGNLFLLPFTASMTFMTLVFVIKAADKTQIYDYGKLLRTVMGKWAIIPLIALIIFPGGVLCLYQAILSEAMPPVMMSFLGAKKGSFIAERPAWILIGSACFFLLSFRRYLADLKISSVFGSIAIVFSVLAVVIRFADGSYSAGGSLAPANWTLSTSDYSVTQVSDGALGIFLAIPIYEFSLAVHNNGARYYEYLENRTPTRIYTAFGISHVLILILYLTMGICGYLTFGPDRIAHTHGNILKAFSIDDTLMNVVRLCYFVVMVTSYPILHFATRKGFNQLVWPDTHAQLPMWILVAETAAIVGISAVIGYVVPSLEHVIDIIGSTAGVVVVNVAPAVLYLGTCVTESDGWSWGRIAAWWSIAFGVIFGCIMANVGLAKSLSK